MKIYLSISYLKSLQEIIDNTRNEKNKNLLRWVFCSRLEKFLTSLDVIYDISKDELYSLLEKSNSNCARTFTEQILFNLISLERPPKHRSINEIDNFNGYYFINDNNLCLLAKNRGVMALQPPKSEYFLFEKYSYANRRLKHNRDGKSMYTNFLQNRPPVNALIIVDKYLLYPSKKMTIDKKTDSIYAFVKYIMGDTSESFHLTMMFSNTQGNESVPRESIEKLKMKFANKNIELELIIYNNFKSTDRVFFTNYSTISMGHPFSEGITYITQNFLGNGHDRQEITEQYQDYLKDIYHIWQKRKSATDSPVENLNCEYLNDPFQNRIFDLLPQTQRVS
jgi:hypothetical protein